MTLIFILLLLNTGGFMLHHLTLGRNKPDGGYVTDLDWQMYCQEVLDSNFDGSLLQTQWEHGSLT